MKKIGILLLIAIIGVSLLFAACSSSPTTGESAVGRDNGGVAVPPAEPAKPSAAPAASDEWGISNMNSSNVVVPSAGAGLKMVFSSQFEINTADYDKDYQKLKDLLAANQGYIETETSSGQKPTTENTKGRISNFTLRVPVANYENFLNGIEGIGKVQSKNMQAQDISSNYYDNEARIKVLEEREAKLNEFLKNATTMEDIIQLEKELSDVMYQLDQLKGTQRGMDKQVAYASVAVNLYEVPEPASLDKSNDSVSDQASKAFSLSWLGVGNFLNGFGIFMAAAAPVIILLLVILAIIFGVMYGVKKLNKKINAKMKK